MPSNWSMIDNSFPTFTGRESPREQVIELKNYMYLLVEQLKYNLENLDTTNWNSKKLEQFQKDTTEDVEENVKTVEQDLENTAADLLTLTQAVADIAARMNALEDLSDRMKRAEENIDFLEKEQQDMQQNLEDLNTAMDETQADLDELFSVFQRTEEGATVGEPGKVLHLVGTVYINGKLME